MPPANYNTPKTGFSQTQGSPRQQVQDEIVYQKDRYNNQQGPLAAAMAQNYGRFSEADYGNYMNMNNQYDAIINGGGGSGGGGGGGGDYGVGAYTPFTVNAGKAGYSDPFKSYGGYEEVSKTGGYSDQDVSNMRARSVAPVRAAYANAEREVQRGRSLQGGYSPNAAAAQVKMAREQSQAGADAMTNVEAGLAQMRQQGRLAGLGGMSNIEGQRLNADVDISKYNTGLDFQGQTYNAGANERAQGNNIQAQQMASSAAQSARQFDASQSLAALNGKRLLYGTTPGASQLFGQQATDIVGQGGNFGTGMVNALGNANQLPGSWEQGVGRANDIMDFASTGIGVGSQLMRDPQNPQQTQTTPTLRATGPYNPGSVGQSAQIGAPPPQYDPYSYDQDPENDEYSQYWY